MVERFFDTLFGAVKSICKIMLCIQVISVTIVFVGRYFFNVTPAWGEERSEERRVGKECR